MPILGILKAGFWRAIYTPMFVTALFIIAKTQKKPKRPPTDDETKWYIHTVEYYYFALKRKEILSSAATRLSLEDVTLSEISQSQKDRCCVIPLTAPESRPGQSHARAYPGRACTWTRYAVSSLMTLPLQQCEKKYFIHIRDKNIKYLEITIRGHMGNIKLQNII